MKSTILHLVSLFLVLAMTASCGKSGSGGSNSGSSSNNITTSGSEAQANLLAWYNSTSEGALPSAISAQVRTVTRSVRSVSTNNGCHSQKLWIFGTIDLCGNISGGGSTTYPSSPVTLIASGDKKINNGNLENAMNPVISPVNGLSISSINQVPSTQTTGSVFTIRLLTAYQPGQQQKTVVHVIDTGLNSRLNPVYTMDGVNGQESSLYNIQPGLNF